MSAIPVTPTKRIRRNLFDDAPATPPRPLKRKKLNFTAFTPESSPEKLEFGPKSVFLRTKALLQKSSELVTLNSNDGALPARSKEYRQVMDFLVESISGQKSDSLYITGPPGTGKTAQLDMIIRQKFQVLPLSTSMERSQQPPRHTNPRLQNLSWFELPGGRLESVAVTSINCISLSEPSSIFQKIFDSFQDLNGPTLQMKNMHHLQRFLEPYHKKTTFVVMLDEMDRLLHANTNETQSVRTILELFLLAKLPTVSFVLIGMANSLDMKDRFLSRLNLNRGLLPKTIVFQPYTAEQMYEIVIQKLSSLPTIIFQPMAIKFAAKKCAGNTGDLRKLFDVLRGSIEIYELENRLLLSSASKSANFPQTPLTPASSPVKQSPFQPQGKIGLNYIAKVFSKFMNNNSTRTKISKLNIQQKLILCTVIQSLKVNSDATIDESFDHYIKAITKTDTLAPLQRNEFLEICTILETCGLVSIKKTKCKGKTKRFVDKIDVDLDMREFYDEMTKITILKPFLH
ncbi:cdc6p [Saccharomyces arboricola H-6]|uniref:Cell division control protein n=1 Tax=Saccharomyces arboricola (strain H-6 / AS 2.3317 / CBS 10644) TaxID=1160507 RepID=J8Q3J9_SACAR|nr:cdc6p [Saccharomyces arboricola H-6]